VSVRTEVTRKALHLATALVPLAWSRGWLPPPVLQRSLLVLAIAAIVAETARALVPAARAAIARLAGSLFRTHEQQGILGATWLAIAMAAAVYAFQPRAAIAALWAVSVGDAAAALAGRTTATATGKTLVGSLACAVTTALGAWWLASSPWPAAAGIGLAAALAERPSLVVDDNLRVTAAAGLAAWALGVA
jgi:dolichol kinase